MKQMEIQKVDPTEVSNPPTITVAVAASGSKRSKYAVKWALDKFIPEGKVQMKLVNVRSRIVRVPTEMGSYLPISQVREDVATAYRREVEWRTYEMLLPYKKICAAREVDAEIITMEADDVAQAISETIAKLSIEKLVISASPHNPVTRKISSSKLSPRISRFAPSFCTVYVVSKGQLLSVRAHTSCIFETPKADSDGSITSGSFTSHSSSSKSEAETTTYTSILESSRCKILDHCITEASCASCSSSMSSDSRHSSLITSAARSFKSDNHLCKSDEASGSENARECSKMEEQDTITLELEKLRIELRHLKEICIIAQNESVDANEQMKELRARCSEEAAKHEVAKLREAKARELVEQGRQRQEAFRKEAEFVKQCAREEAIHRRDAEDSAVREATEKQRLEQVLAYNDEPFVKYSWEEIVSATLSLSESLKIGVGANGVVYKATFHHTTAAVKVLHSFEPNRVKQFKQELEIMGRIRHPHLLLLLGACTERGCLVYEYMENGSLDDRLHRKNGMPPLPWYYRFRIAWEIASALGFLHNTKPQPIIHRDLKPANILLDDNFVSKIGDIGLSTFVSSVDPAMSTMYKNTAPIGTICYIDPEYQRSGLVSPKSDVYALGIVILELLTGKSPMGLAHIVESAIEEDCLMDILDFEAGRWPFEEAKEFAILGLSCAEMRRKDRPDLKHIISKLERLKELADKACDTFQDVPSDPPSHFICPILKEVMDDPCVASDGYTYERRAIEYWFSLKDKSPITNLKVTDRILIPNHALRSAIKDWKSRTD